MAERGNKFERKEKSWIRAVPYFSFFFFARAGVSLCVKEMLFLPRCKSFLKRLSLRLLAFVRFCVYDVFLNGSSLSCTKSGKK